MVDCSPIFGMDGDSPLTPCLLILMWCLYHCTARSGGRTNAPLTKTQTTTMKLDRICSPKQNGYHQQKTVNKTGIVTGESARRLAVARPVPPPLLWASKPVGGSNDGDTIPSMSARAYKQGGHIDLITIDGVQQGAHHHHCCFLNLGRHKNDRLSFSR